jgi:hypothetical protein
MQGEPQTRGPVSQVENWVFITFFVARGQRCLSGAKEGEMSPRKREMSPS